MLDHNLTKVFCINFFLSSSFFMLNYLFLGLNHKSTTLHNNPYLPNLSNLIIYIECNIKTFISCCIDVSSAQTSSFSVRVLYTIISGKKKYILQSLVFLFPLRSLKPTSSRSHFITHSRQFVRSFIPATLYSIEISWTFLYKCLCHFFPKYLFLLPQQDAQNFVEPVQEPLPHQLHRGSSPASRREDPSAAAECSFYYH